ncbi:MAG: flavodoxin family protein [Oscillospiraceae bacterium]|jgi:multimeric flavodoxin WrbA|nr:flavodoxin family protein [Oscillospiraceae bacterium]
MKVLAVNGSPRKNGNTADMLKAVLDVCEKAGLETELYQAGGLPLRACLACEKCFSNPGKCVTQDWIQELYGKMKAADALILGSPTYYGDLTPEIKAVMDRCGYLSLSEGGVMKRKVGAAVTAVRRAGGLHTLDSMQHFFLIQGMIVPGSTYWNMSLSLEPGDFAKDEEGVGTMLNLGDNIVWLLQKINS